ncbi:MAG: MBL fold metallo-hydrolase [Roseburia sp.]
MRVIFIHHSCFVVELDEKVLIFDWFAGDRVEGFQFRGTLPEYEPDTPVYVFASHKHRDHFDIDVLHLAEKYRNIHFIFSKDCKMTGNFLKKHGFPESVRDKILYTGANARYRVDDVEIETLRSTDAGVAFYVESRGISCFHAGDLNDWKWDGAGELVNGNMERAYRGQIRLLKNKKINLAFIPMDSRQGSYQTLGMDYFLQNVDADYVFPMHMWQDYSGIGEYKRKITNQAMAERIVELYHENQVVPIEVR